MDISWKVRRLQWNSGSDNYSELKRIRQEISVKHLKVIKLEKDLSTARSLLYSLNKALNFASTTHIITSENKSPSDKAKKKFLKGIKHKKGKIYIVLLSLYFLE